MPFLRVLLAIDPTLDPEPVLRAAERVAPGALEVHVLALLADEVAASAREGHLPGLEQLQEGLRSWGARPVAGAVETGFDVARIAEARRRVGADLVVLGPWKVRSALERALALFTLTSREEVHVLSVGSGCGKEPLEPGLVGFAFDADGAALAGGAPIIAALTGVRRLLALVPAVDEARQLELMTALRSMLPERELELVVLAGRFTSLAESVERAAAERHVELLVVSSDGLSSLTALATGLFAAQILQDGARPALVLRRSAGRESLLAERLVASDTLLLPGVVAPIALERTSTLGRTGLGPDERFNLAGLPGAPVLPHEEGVVLVPPELVPETREERPVTLSSTAAPQELAPLRGLAPSRPLLLLDAALDAAAIASAAALGHQLQPVFVRLRAAQALDSVRARLATDSPWVEPPVLIDATAWLGDAGAPDVPSALDAQRLLRLGLRLGAAGAPVAAVLVRGDHRPRSTALLTLTPGDCAERDPAEPAPVGIAGATPEHARTLELVSGAPCVEGHAVELELDNARARASVLAAIAAARTRVHWQCYIVEDDEVAEAIATALREAAARGVEVRVLVDAVYSLHGAFGTANPVLERLAAAKGVEVRAFQPVSGVPSLADLKQRNHRKLVIIDGGAAFITGRNLGAPYYTGFEEVTLSRSSTHHQVPWLDASVQLRGPLVATAEESFRTDWVRSGGGSYSVEVPPPAGPYACRLVLHEGMVDTHTLDTQLAMIAQAQRRVLVVNTFPLLLELQRALILAVRRGVQVQMFFGSVRPRFGEDQPFPGGVIRGLGDDLVRSRLDPLIRAGAEGYEAALTPLPGWESELGRVFPHVHAKIIARDDEAVAIGSANVDVTSAYWESEAVLLVQDAGFTRATLAALAPYLSAARKVDLSAESWAKDAARRAWLGRNWPMIVG